MKFDHLRLPEVHRTLIRAVSPMNADSVFLEPLDKGLSGAAVWLAQWSLTNGTMSSLSVLKINERKKIELEKTAFDHIVSWLDNAVGVFNFYFSGGDEDSPSILNQPFKGDHQTLEIKNLRHRIWKCASPKDAEKIIDNLYNKRMSNWHPQETKRGYVESSFLQALDWWAVRYNLSAVIDSVGAEAVRGDFAYHFNLELREVLKVVDQILIEKGNFCIGPVHGDLHAQNILFDEDDKIHLIDFGWTAERWKAIDFLMLECSLKFLIAPRTARQADLIAIDECADAKCDLTRFDTALYPTELKLVAAAVRRVREHCLGFGYADLELYRKGLVVLTGCLAGHPGLNRRFLLNSLCYNVSRLKNAN